MSILKFLKQLFCRHEWMFVRDLVDDEKMYCWGSEYVCSVCGKEKSIYNITRNS